MNQAAKPSPAELQILQILQAALPLNIAVQLPHGQWLGAANASVKLIATRWSSLARLKAGQIGALAEGYVEGRMQLEGSMRDIMRAVSKLLPVNPLQADSSWWRKLMHSVTHSAKSAAAHSPVRDAAQIQFHYDVSDAFYALWLDPRQVYSCAYYPDLAKPDFTLAQAQTAKLDHICRKLMLKPGQRFLDIGAGWGALLFWAAEHYGVDATGITLSKNQYLHTQALIEKKGLGHRVRMQLCDYRDLPLELHQQQHQSFDKISSVGMFEHVGKAQMPAYFSKIMQLLTPGGLVLNHGITAGGLNNHQLGAGLGDFIEKYIFPGGELIHASAVLSAISSAGLEMLDTENLRPHYARTLWDWSDALEQKLPEAQAILRQTESPQQSHKTIRAYRIYLAGSAMGFERGWISLHQFLAMRPTREGAESEAAYPFNRSYMYPSQH